MSSLKDLSEELASYIEDAEKLERVVEAFRELEKTKKFNSALVDAAHYQVGLVRFEKLKALIDDE